MKPVTQKKLWRFRCFVSERGTHVIDEWLKTISTKGKAKFQRALEHLAAQEDRTQWSRPQASPLGNHIYVIRFKDENRTEHRVFGHFHGNSLVFILTLTGTEQNNVYIPSDYEKRAKANQRICDKQFDDRTKECFVLAAHRLEDELHRAESGRLRDIKTPSDYSAPRVGR